MKGPANMEIEIKPTTQGPQDDSIRAFMDERDAEYLADCLRMAEESKQGIKGLEDFESTPSTGFKIGWYRTQLGFYLAEVARMRERMEIRNA